MPTDNFCWMCHRECSPKLSCDNCDRSYHLSCVSEFRPTLTRGPDGLKKFTKWCPECFKTADAAKRWTKGQDFEPITRKTLNQLLVYIIRSIKEEAPGPFLWPTSWFRGYVHPMDVHKIEQRAKDNFYDSPKHFLNDVYLINHNCMIMWRNPVKLRIDRATSKQLTGYDEVVKEFKQKIDAKVRYLEDCPHCVWNFTRNAENWLTMACPWGHPLIITEMDRILRPAKMIKFNRSSGRVDIILFGTFGVRTRVSADKCWIPCAADLAIDNNRDSKDIQEAKKGAQKYIETLEKRFKVKNIFEKEKRLLSALDKDYVKRNSPREEADDVIELTDDESSVVQETNLNRGDEDVELGESANTSNSNGESSGRTDGSPGGDEINVINDMIDDEVIDEVGGTDESSSSSEAKQNDSSPPPSPVLRTIIERISPSPEPNAASSGTSSNKPAQVHIPKSKPVPTQILTPIQTPTDTPPLTPVPIITQTQTSTPPPPLLPTPPPFLSPSPPPLLTPSPPSSLSEQFSIVSDDEFDTLNNEMDTEPTEKEDEPSTKSLLSSEFVVEEDRDSVGETLNPQFQPISPFCFTCIQEDKIFESTISASSISSNLLSDDSDFQFIDSHLTKKMKLDHDSGDTKLLDEIKRLEQQLEFSEKEKQLNLQQIADVQDQLKLTKQMEGTRLKTIELQFSSQINTLKDTLEKERKEKEDLNQKFVASLAGGYQAMRMLEETKLSWETRLKEELKSKDDQHKKEMDTKMEEIVTLKRKLQESEEAFKQLEHNYNIILLKYNKLSSKLFSLSQELGDTDKFNSPKQ